MNRATSSVTLMNLLRLCLAIAIASVPLQILRFLASVTQRYLKPFEGIHSGIVEAPFRSKWSFEAIVMTEFFEIALPAFFFALILPFLPLSGIRAGVFFGILVFFVGSLPQALVILQTVRLPVNFVIVHLFWQLLKNLVIFGVIGTVYRF
jgi:hypothetical protein